MQQMVESDYNLVTVMKDNKAIGQVSLRDMVAAISKPKPLSPGQQQLIASLTRLLKVCYQHLFR